MSWRTAAAAGVLVMIAAGAVAIAGEQHPDLVQPIARSQTMPVSAATLSCPRAPLGRAAVTRVFAVAPAPRPPASPASDSTARLRLTAAQPGNPLLAATGVAGVPLRATPPAASAVAPTGAVVSAAGSLAAGAAGAEVSTYGSARTSGIAVSGCAAPQAQWWFNGVDTSVGSTTRLQLSNPGAGIAVVDVAIFGPRGLIPAPGAQGVALAPGARRALDLAGFAPGRAALAVHVTAVRGTIAAAVSTSRLEGLTPTGTDWVPPSTGPGATVVVGAGVAGATQQRLVVVNPGQRQQLVAVRLLDASGAFVPSGLPNLQVPPGSVVVRDLRTVTHSRASAVELSAATPVTGAIVSEVSGASRDFAVSGVSEVLTGPAVVPAVDGARLAMALTATTPTPEPVTIEAFDRAGARVSVVRLLAAGSATTSWSLPRSSGASYVVVTAAGRGSVQAVVTYTGAAGAAQLPVLSGRYTVREPGVVAAYP